jgi:hypothetical protein
MLHISQEELYGVLKNVLMKFKTHLETKEQHFEPLILFKVRMINIITSISNY